MIFHSAFELSYLWLIIIGFVIGFLASFIGGGGGFCFIAILILLFRVPAHVAITTSLSATLPICLVGTLGHYKYGNIDLQLGLIFIITGILGAFAGAFLTKLMSSEHLKISFGVYSALLGIIMMFGNIKKKRAEEQGIQLPEVTVKGKVTKGSFFGFLAGVITGTFGTSGTAPVLAGLFAIRIPVKIVVGTSLMIAFVNTVSALVAHFMVGKIDLTLIFFLTAGSIIGALTGPGKLAGIRIGNAEYHIRKWYAVAMIAFGIIMVIS